jgi:hypothetical protein
MYKNSVHTSQETHCFCYKDQPVNAVYGNNHCLLWEPYVTQMHSVGRMQCFSADGTYGL